LHSSWVGNPIHRLVAALATLRTADDLDVAIEGYYGEGEMVSEDDEALVQDLAARLDPQAILDDLGVSRFKQGDFINALRAHCFQSEFNISGISGGHVIEGGHKVTLPTEAVASVD